MLSPTLWENLAGYLVTPVAVWVSSVGLGLLAERACGARVSNPLLIPLGFCVAVVLCLGVYKTGAGDSVLLPVMAVLVLVGFLLARRELPGRLNGGWPLIAGIAAFVMFDFSVIATGHWTFTGYNLQDDIAYELLLAHHMQSYGTANGALPTDTASAFISSFLSTGYPLGGQAYLAALGGFIHTDLAAIWQGYLSSLAGVGAVAAATISGRAFDKRIAALVGVLAMSAALTFQYAMQGSIKEVATVVAVLCAIALIRHAILELRGVAAAVIIAVPLAAILVTYNAAGLPFVGGLAGSALLASVLVHRRLPTLRWWKPVLIGGVVFVVLAIPALTTLLTFLRVSKALYTGSNALALPLGQLLRPLPLSEVSGIWLAGDYRVAVAGGSTGEAEVIGTVLMFALAILGTTYALRKREPGPLMGLLTMGLVLLIVYPKAIPYAQAKLLAIASPVVVLGAAQGVAALRRMHLTPVAVIAGLVLGGGIVLSDALAYHHDPVAPTRQLLAVRAVGRHLGAKGPVLMSEFQEFAKYFSQPALVDIGTEYPTSENLVLRNPGGLYDQSFDTDEEQLAFVESFPYLIVRRSAADSRPPANFKLIYEDDFYELWQRQQTPKVLAHLPLQQQYLAYAPIGCPALGAMVRHAPAGSELEVARTPVSIGYDALGALPPGWIQDPNQFGGNSVIPLNPGTATADVVAAHTGYYRAWVAGTFPRAIVVKLDGQTVGQVAGQNTPDEWLEAGRVKVSAGEHQLSITRGNGSLAAGDGGTGTVEGKGDIGHVSLVAEEPKRTEVMPVSAWHSLCGQEADWVELIAPAG
jgi:hypothetical protein